MGKVFKTTRAIAALSLIAGLLIQVVRLCAADVDPDLRPGFPVKVVGPGGGSYRGPTNYTLVGNIDGDPGFEIIVSGSSGLLYAWKSDGSLLPGWPLAKVPGMNYPTLGELSRDYAGDEIFSGTREAFGVDAFSSTGQSLPTWPFHMAAIMETPASLADVDHDGLDEIFLNISRYWLDGFKADGSELPGWPVNVAGGGNMTAAIGDLDGDGELEIVSASSQTAEGGRPTNHVYISAFHHDGTTVTGFPVMIPGAILTFPVIGDVDGDGLPEIVALGYGDGSHAQIFIFSGDGTLKRTIPLGGTLSYATAPALADLDGDGVPEIIVQLDASLEVVRGDGTAFPGWPVATGGFVGSSSPVVGDVDGDGLPDIVIVTSDLSFPDRSKVQAYNRAGHLLRRFPKMLPLDWGAVPAIADLDGNGRNQIIVTGTYWNVPGNFGDKVWVYDLGAPSTGAAQWSQFMEGPKHNGTFRGGFDVPANKSILDVRKLGTGTGTVLASGISCGTDCSETLSNGTSVTLVATADGPGSVFAGWQGGACSGTGDCVVDLQVDTTVTAVFELVYVNLTVTKAGTGLALVYSNPTGVYCDTHCTGSYVKGTSVTLSASTGFGGGPRFDGWSGGGCSGTGSCTVLMDGDKTVTAAFTAGGFAYAQKGGTGQGTITSSPEGIVCGDDCAEFYPTGMVVTFTATPAKGSFFKYWDGPCGGSKGLCVVSMQSGTFYFAAEFEKIVTFFGIPASVRIGTKFPISWWFAPELNFNPQYVKIDLSRDGGATWKPISKKGLNDGIQAWKVKGPPTATAKFRVCSLSPTLLCGESETFRIQ